MAERGLLAANRLWDFREWARERGWMEADPVSQHELFHVALKMKHPEVRATLVIYKHGAGVHVSVPSGVALRLVREWLRGLRKPAQDATESGAGGVQGAEGGGSVQGGEET